MKTATLYLRFCACDVVSFLLILQSETAEDLNQSAKELWLHHSASEKIDSIDLTLHIIHSILVHSLEEHLNHEQCDTEQHEFQTKNTHRCA